MDDPVPNERRCVRRLSAHTISPLHLRVEAGGPSLRAIAENISVKGIGLVVDSKLEPGTLVAIQVGSAGKNLSPELKALVRHVRRRPDGKWLLGCSFCRDLTAEDILVLGQ